MPRPIYVYWSPNAIGGATSEMFAAARLWRSAGLDVVLVGPRVADVYDGFRVVQGVPDGSIVVGFCSSRFRRESADLKRRGCTLIYAPCMNFPWPEEFAANIADWYVFQSQFQESCIAPRLSILGLSPDRCRLIRGALDESFLEVKPLPHTPGEPFIIGRMSRAYGADGKSPCYEKFPQDLWKQYEAITYRPLRARVMGWSPEIEAYCGKPPEWAEVLPAGAEPPQHFLSTIHCLVPGIGCIAENWPRVGLEAMAACVPIVAENHGGWKEMLPYVCPPNRERQSEYVARLANSEAIRRNVASIGEAYLSTIADPDEITTQWLDLFEEAGL